MHILLNAMQKKHSEKHGLRNTSKKEPPRRLKIMEKRRDVFKFIEIDYSLYMSKKTLKKRGLRVPLGVSESLHGSREGSKQVQKGVPKLSYRRPERC